MFCSPGSPLQTQITLYQRSVKNLSGPCFNPLWFFSLRYFILLVTLTRTGNTTLSIPISFKFKNGNDHFEQATFLQPCIIFNYSRVTLEINLD